MAQPAASAHAARLLTFAGGCAGLTTALAVLDVLIRYGGESGRWWAWLRLVDAGAAVFALVTIVAYVVGFVRAQREASRVKTEQRLRDEAEQARETEQGDFERRVLRYQNALGGFAVPGSETRFPQWSSAALAMLYPGEVFHLAGRPHVAFIRPARGPARIVKSELRFPELVDGVDVAYQQPPDREYAETYLRIVQAPLLRDGEARANPILNPAQLGYVPLRWLDGGEAVVSCGLCTYRDTVATAHLLEFELFDVFAKMRGRMPQSREDIVGRTTIRRELGLHDVRDIPTAQPSFRPMLGVQALVVVRGDHEPRVILMHRSDHVAVKPGWFQFPPSGGFETWNVQAAGGVVSAAQHDALFRQCDPGAALLREFVEELFGFNAWQVPVDESFSNLWTAAEARPLMSLFAAGRARARFLGVVADAAGLRAELSFLIVVDRPAWRLLRGIEARAALDEPTFAQLAKRLADPAIAINPPSAALLRLAIDGGALHDERVLRTDEAARLFGP